MPLEQFLYRWPHEHNQREDPENKAGKTEEIQDADEEAESVSALLPQFAPCHNHQRSVGLFSRDAGPQISADKSIFLISGNELRRSSFHSIKQQALSDLVI